MSRRHLVREDDLARIVKGLKLGGVEVDRVEIDQAGNVVVISRRPSDQAGDGPESFRTELEALRKRNAERRAERAAPRQKQAG